ncbi:MAG: phage tail tape measure protein, partial [Candidatus Cloacimonetes bacterium]|nr:phage tail tape measure protein [Candidatus Cloacimonadota bacterium]
EIKDAEKAIRDSAKRLSNISSGTQLINSKDIEIQIQRINNSLARLKVNKDKVFADSRVVSEVAKLKEMENAFRRGEISARQYSLQLDNLRTRVAQVSGQFRNANRDGYTFTQMLTLATKKIAIWGIGTSLIYGSFNQLKMGLQTLKELDSAMVEIAKVTDLTTESLNRLKDASFDSASAYGRTAQDFLASVAEFSRAGYDTMASGLAEMSLLAQNVGELTAEQANAFLLATDAAYKYKGSQEELGRVLDGVNQIDNRFATSIQKISEGMTVAGSIASNAGVQVDELAAAVGTMTAITQRSGNEAGRAFRSILMNIRQIKG